MVVPRPRRAHRPLVPARRWSTASMTEVGIEGTSRGVSAAKWGGQLAPLPRARGQPRPSRARLLTTFHFRMRWWSSTQRHRAGSRRHQHALPRHRARDSTKILSPGTGRPSSVAHPRRHDRGPSLGRLRRARAIRSSTSPSAATPASPPSNPGAEAMTGA